MRSGIRALLIGAASGSRSQAGLAAVALTTPRPGPRWPRLPAATAAIGELVIDKLPAAPSRLDPGALTVRVLSGATAAALLAGRFRARRPPAVLAAAGAAVAASVLGAAWRDGAVDAGLSPFTAALAEDTVAFALAFVACA